MRKEVEIKCPHCGCKDKSVKAFGNDVFIYECNDCNQSYRVEFERIPTYCGRLNT